MKVIGFRSIIKQPNLKIQQAFSFFLQNTKEEFKLEEIRACLLSCGNLSFCDEQLFSRLLTDLYSQISSVEETQLNSNDLYTIILSIGMLALRDEKLLDTVCNHLVLNKDKYPKALIVNFVTSCGSVNFSPEKIDDLIAEIKIDLFDLADESNAIHFLNLTLALCQLEKPNRTFIETLLSEKIWKNLLSGEFFVLLFAL